MDIRRIMLMAAMMPCIGFASEVKGSMGGRYDGKSGYGVYGKQSEYCCFAG